MCIRDRVKVKGTEGNKATLKIKRYFKSANARKVEAAKKEIYLDSTNLDGVLLFFVQHPDYRFSIDEDGYASYHNSSGNWNHTKNRFYEVKIDFTIELSVPKTTNLNISTHQKNLTISNINADVVSQNHHGHIELNAIGGNVQAHTHHGEIEASLTKAPTKDAVFDTHHGNIEISFPNNLSADISLKTKHGNFYTEFDYQPMARPISYNKHKKGTKYKIEAGTNIRINKGGPKLCFETYHGNIYLLK